jgi:hypothetical protein
MQGRQNSEVGIQKSEEMHKDCLDDYMDIGGRTMPGAIVEQSMPSIQSIQGFLFLDWIPAFQVV